MTSSPTARRRRPGSDPIIYIQDTSPPSAPSVSVDDRLDAQDVVLTRLVTLAEETLTEVGEVRRRLDEAGL